MGEETDNKKGFFENPVKQENEWLTTSEAARYLRVSENALRIKVHRGELAAHRFGCRLRFCRSDLLKAITSSTPALKRVAG